MATPNQPIDTVAVRLSLDGKEAFEQADELLESIKTRAEEMANTAEDAFSKAADATSETNENLEEQNDLLSQLADLQKKAGDAADELARKQKDAADQTAASTDSLEDRFKLLFEFGNRIGALIEETGLPITERYVQKVEALAGGLSEMIMDTNVPIEQLRKKMEDFERQLTQVILEEAKLGDMGEAAFNKILKAAQEKGVKGIERLRKTWKNTIDDIVKGSETIEEAQERIKAYTQETISGFEGAAGAAGGGGLQNILGIFSKVAGILAIIGISIKTLKEFQAFISEGTENFIEYTKTLFELEVAVRAYQRAQSDSTLTIQDWKNEVRDLTDQYGGPFKNNVVEAAQVINYLGTNTKLTDDQMKGLLEDAVILNRVLGTDTVGNARALATYISTGLADSLRQYNIVLNESTFAQAALDLGINKTKNEMSEAEVQAVRYQEIQNQIALSAEDAALAQETLAGRMEKANNSIEESQERLGKLFAYFEVRGEEVKAIFLESAVPAIEEFFLKTLIFASRFTHGVFGLFELIIRGAETVIEVFENLPTSWEDFTNRIANGERVFDTGDKGLAYILEGFNEQMGKADEFSENLIRNILQIDEGLGDVDESMRGINAQADELDEEFKKIADEAMKAIEDAMRRWKDGIEDANRRLDDQLEDIAEDTRRRRADAELDLIRDLADIQRDAAKDKIEAIEDAADEEAKIREDHYNRLKELEMRFLFDITDALRDRDARRVLELVSRFNFEKQKLAEEAKEKEAQRKQDLAKELQDIENQATEKAALRIQDYQRELQDIQTQEARKIRDAQIAHQRRLRDLEISIQRRLELVAQGVAEELNYERAKIEALYQMMNQAYGPNGFVEFFYQRALAAQAAYLSASAGMGGGALAATNAVQPSQNPEKAARLEELLRGRGFQTGGSFVATSPMMIGVGESRPERVTVTPLSGGLPVPGKPGSSFGGSGRHVIEIDLGDGLVGRIVDQAMAETADVVVTLAQKRQGVGGMR